MIPYVHHVALALCAVLLLACAGDAGPVAVTRDSAADAALPAFAYSTAEPTEEEMAEMPAEFQSAPSIFSASTDVDFIPGAGVYAQASMSYFATDAEQEVTLVLRKDDRAVYSKTAKEVQEDFLPALRSMYTMVSFAVSAACGHTADGQTAHRAWHKFIVGGWRYLSWGRNERPSGGTASQSACVEPPPSTDEEGDGGGGSAYETGCESCQQWFWYEDGEIVDEWWECTPVDISLCEGLAS